MTPLEQAVESCGLGPEHARNLSGFISLFEKWNRSINLSAARDRASIAEHVIDSLPLVPMLSTADTRDVLDVGSGGGFPVVVAALCLPDREFVSLEPVHKKHAFLRTAARELGIANLDARAERLEDHTRRDYSVATSRATFDLVEWLARGLAYVRPGGRVIAFEAVPRDDLPPGAVRHPYELGGKSRALVVVSRFT